MEKRESQKAFNPGLTESNFMHTTSTMQLRAQNVTISGDLSQLWVSRNEMAQSFSPDSVSQVPHTYIPPRFRKGAPLSPLPHQERTHAAPGEKSAVDLFNMGMAGDLRKGTKYDSAAAIPSAKRGGNKFRTFYNASNSLGMISN